MDLPAFSPTEADKEWLRHPKTQEFRRFLMDHREYLKERWAREGFYHPDSKEAHYRNTAALAQASLLMDLAEQMSIANEEVEE
jgi:hypothetical protein